MKKHVKQILSLALALTMMVTLFAGCGQTPPASSANTPSRNIVRMANTSGGWTNPDPTFANRAPDTTITGAVYESLYRVKHNNELEPLLAESLSISPDGMEYTYQLKKGVKFHSGDELKASDVVFSFERAKESSTMSEATRNIEKVEAVGDYTVKITLHTFNSIFDLLAATVPVVSEKVVTAAGAEPDFSTLAAGTGAYTIDTWKADEKVVLKANPNYHGEKAKIETVEYIVFGDTTSALMAFEADQIDYYAIPKADWARIKESGKYNTALEMSDRTVFIGFNCAKEPFNNPLVRQAINYAINRQEIIDAVTYGMSPEASHIGVPGKHRAVPEYDDVFHYEFNLEKAKELMKQAGYEKGIKLSQGVNCSSTSSNDIVVLTLLQEQLGKIGIEFEIAPQENATNTTHYVGGNYLMCLWSNGTGKEAARIVGAMYAQGGAYNIIHVVDEKVDELHKKATQTTDQAERKDLYIQLYNQVNEQAYYAPLYWQVNSVAWNKTLNADPTTPVRTWSWN